MAERSEKRHERANDDCIRSALSKVEAGFCLSHEMTPKEKGHVFEAFPDATIIKFVSPRSAGGAKYSTLDLLGHPLTGLNYVVLDELKFNAVMALRFESDFKKSNPNPTSHVRSAFTRFMHNNGLHWSRCCQVKQMTTPIGITPEQYMRLKEIASKKGIGTQKFLEEIVEAYLEKAQEGHALEESCKESCLVLDNSTGYQSEG